MNPDYKFERLERAGCIIYIRMGLQSEGKEVTLIEIIPDKDWNFDGCVNNWLTRTEGKEEEQ